MNKWDDQLKDFMLSAEEKCGTFKNDNIEWSPTIKMWLSRRWVIARLQKFIAKKGLEHVQVQKSPKSLQKTRTERPKQDDTR